MYKRFSRTQLETEIFRVLVTNCRKRMNAFEKRRWAICGLLAVEDNWNYAEIVYRYMLEAFLEILLLNGSRYQSRTLIYIHLQPLQKRFFGLSKRLEQFMIQYFYSNKISTNTKGLKKNQSLFSRVKTCVLLRMQLHSVIVWEVLYHVRNESGIFKTRGFFTTNWNDVS